MCYFATVLYAASAKQDELSSLLEKADTLAKEGHLEKAIETYGAALHLSPENQEALTVRSTTCTHSQPYCVRACPVNRHLCCIVARGASSLSRTWSRGW